MFVDTNGSVWIAARREKSEGMIGGTSFHPSMLIRQLGKTLINYIATVRPMIVELAHVLFGKPGNNPFCHHRALELAKQGRRERLRKIAEAPGMPFDYGRFEIVEEAWPPGELRRIL